MTFILLCVGISALFSASTAAAQSFIPTGQVEWAGGHSTCCGGEGSDEFALTNGDRFGRSSAGIGDLDGDGVPDVVIGSSRDSTGAKKAGALYVLFLNADNTVKSQAKISNDDGNFVAAPSPNGESYGALQQEDRFGYSSGRIGDVDGDGVVDVCVGADGDDDGYADNSDAKVQRFFFGCLFFSEKRSRRYLLMGIPTPHHCAYADMRSNVLTSSVLTGRPRRRVRTGPCARSS